MAVLSTTGQIAVPVRTPTGTKYMIPAGTMASPVPQYVDVHATPPIPYSGPVPFEVDFNMLLLLIAVVGLSVVAVIFL